MQFANRLSRAPMTLNRMSESPENRANPASPILGSRVCDSTYCTMDSRCKQRVLQVLCRATDSYRGTDDGYKRWLSKIGCWTKSCVHGYVLIAETRSGSYDCRGRVLEPGHEPEAPGRG